MATALDDFTAPDCRFINIKMGQTVYVYSKLIPEEGAGVFWSGSVRECFFFHQECRLQSVKKKIEESHLVEYSMSRWLVKKVKMCEAY